MKTVRVDRSFSYRAKAKVFVQYQAETVYRRVPEAHARAIVAAGAGAIVEDESGVITAVKIAAGEITGDRGVI